MKSKFGTAPVFFTAISTILGAVMFLRFGFAVGQVGLLGTLAIILIGHAVTIPTAMAIAEIATNQKVEGGGEYYIISRSFGLVIGAAIGIALYLSQAISVAFYIIAFSEAFNTLVEYLVSTYAFPPWIEYLIQQKQTIGVPALLMLTVIVLVKGADLGVKALYTVVFTLFLSLVAFFIGETAYSKTESLHWLDSVRTEVVTKVDTSTPQETTTFTEFITTDGLSRAEEELSAPPPESPETPVEDSGTNPIIPLGFFTVFAIIFPGFTGMTAGVGLSGDLKNPGRSIPLGTLAATLCGMIIYVFIAFKLASSASPADLADTSKLVMADIAWQGWWLIPIGLAAATISSALGSILVAPRTLQAIARDRLLPSTYLNRWLSRGKGKSDEPFNASLITVAIALFFILLGALDSVAEVISMFFMVTYGSLCLISFLQHFAADPSYRPKFRSRWYFSLFGAVLCFGLMFFMNAPYALAAIVFMLALYFILAYFNPDKQNVAVIFQGVIFQFSRQLQVFLQKAKKEQTGSWRPAAVCISKDTFSRRGAFDLLRWLSHKYGFGTYIHLLDGYLSKNTNTEGKHIKERLIKMAENSKSNIYVDTIVSPSFTSSIAQVIQLPGLVGTDNNLLIFDFSKSNPSNLDEVIDNFKLIRAVDFDIAILGTCERGFGFKREIHVWITTTDYTNANLMILMAYVLLGHPDWSDAAIKIKALYPEHHLKEERQRLLELIKNGQLPISPNNIRFIPHKQDVDAKAIINQNSADADLTILGFRDEILKHQGKETFQGYESLGSTLFINAGDEIKIK